MEVIFQAHNVRKERTGIHATVSIGIRPTGKGAIPCDEDTYNVGRHPDRERLVNAIYKRPEFKKVFEAGGYPQSKMSLDLMLFQRGLWNFELGQQEPKRRRGSMERRSPGSSRPERTMPRGRCWRLLTGSSRYVPTSEP